MIERKNHWRSLDNCSPVLDLLHARRSVLRRSALLLPPDGTGRRSRRHGNALASKRVERPDVGTGYTSDSARSVNARSLRI